MTTDEQDWRDRLWTRYASFFDWSAPRATGLWSLPDGWRATVEAMLANVADIVRADGLGRLTITRLALRDGVPDIHYATASTRFRAMIDAEIDRFSARAACTCDECGVAAKRYPVPTGVAPRCDVHRPRGAAAVEPAWPLIRIERAIEGGVSRVVRCRLYDRGLDRFVDTDPAALGIPRTP